MPPRHREAAEPAPATTAGERPPGKPQSQVEAETPPDAETAAMWAAEYDSRVYWTDERAAPAAAVPAETAETGNPRDWAPSGKL